MMVNRRGIVFVILLWAIAALTTVSLYFAQSARLAYLASESQVAGLQADHAINSAIDYVAYVIETENRPGEFIDLEALGYMVQEVPIGEARIWFLGEDRNAIVRSPTPVFGILCEASRLNINTAELEMLEALPGMTPELAAAIIDWRDLDEELTPLGAESSDYLTLTPAYTAKNSDFESIEEVRLLRGASLEVLYGEDYNLNGLLDANENDGDLTEPPDNADGVLQEGILRYITVHSREPNTRSDGTPKVNLRGESARTDLEQLVSERLGDDVMQQIIGALGPNLGNPESVLAFYIDSNLSEDQFRQLEDSLTVSPGAYRFGAINVHTAPVEVLACLPGVTREKAEELVSSRQSLSEEQRQSVAWLTTVLDPDVARLVGPHVTAQTWQYRLDITAVGRHGRGVRRMRAIVDVEDGVNVIQRRDLSRGGWALGEEVRLQLAEGRMGR